MVLPHVNLRQVPGGQQPIGFSGKNRKKVRLQGYLVRAGVIPGGKLVAYIDLQNPTGSNIKRIEVRLIQHREAVQTHYALNIFQVELPDLVEFNGAEFKQTFELPISATYLSPTYTKRYRNTQNFSICWSQL